MSSDQNVISFPVDQLKAETLRSMAKDLNVPSGGKKEDLLKRMRTSSASGWTTPLATPSKRKGDEEASEPVSRVKKPRTPKSAKMMEGPSSPVRSSPCRSPVEAPKEAPQETTRKDASSEVKTEGNEEKPEVSGAASKYPPFDEYFVEGTTRVFLTSDDLTTILDHSGDLMDPLALPLWKPMAQFADSGRKPEERIEHWIILIAADNAIQNVAAFREAQGEALEKRIKPPQADPALEANGAKDDTKDSTNGTMDDTQGITGTKDDTDGAKVPVERATMNRWYEGTVSRKMSKGALAVKLIKAEMTVPNGVMPLNSAEEEGNFWLSNMKPASPEDTETLTQVRGQWL